MKTLKLFIAILLLGVAFSYAGNPNQKTKTEKATTYVSKIKADVQLTDSQTVKLKKSAEKYFELSSNARLITNETIRANALLDIQQAFKNERDSILTANQRSTLSAKTSERKQKR